MIFEKKVTERNTFDVICYTHFVWNITLRRTLRDVIINVHRSSCKVPLFLPDFNET